MALSFHRRPPPTPTNPDAGMLTIVIFFAWPLPFISLIVIVLATVANRSYISADGPQVATAHEQLSASNARAPLPDLSQVLPPLLPHRLIGLVVIPTVQTSEPPAFDRLCDALVGCRQKATLARHLATWCVPPHAPPTPPTCAARWLGFLRAPSQVAGCGHDGIKHVAYYDSRNIKNVSRKYPVGALLWLRSLSSNRHRWPGSRLTNFWSEFFIAGAPFESPPGPGGTSVLTCGAGGIIGQ